jgi:predicted MPP superfamily phosphohydrolase
MQLKSSKFIIAALFITAAVLGLWAFVLEPASLTTKTHQLRIPYWNADLAGLRVAVLADLHVGSPYNGIEKLKQIVELTNSLHPDLVVVPGDLVITKVFGGNFVPPEEFAVVLAQLKAPLGVWATMGNHDYWLDAPRVIAALEKEKIGVLQDDSVRIQRGNAHFWLVGISDFWAGPHDFKKAISQVKDDASVLMFTHNPDVFPMLTNRFSLLMAGHTHGGQVNFPFFGRPKVPSNFGERYAHGHVIENGRHLFVSTGVGTSDFSVRFRVPPEITLLELFPL